jgi:transcriptional regulator with GAF, ATPase, and Fis domain
MQAVERRALRVAPSGETVLILGETGVGKDLLARLIHQNSPRHERPFVHLNCASLPESLLETELFGHVRGAYTGATESRPGQFEAAAGGTLFLDEIAEIPPRLQAKLLHVLQERKIYRVGGRESLRVDVRVVAATNRDLHSEIRSGAFRRDLFYRLNVVTLKVPPLRERHEDLEGLALLFFRMYAAAFNREELPPPGPDFVESLRRSPWRGNVRELENFIKRWILLGSEEVPGEPHTGTPDRGTEGMRMEAGAPGVPVPLKELTRRVVAEAERRAILETLRRTSWNRKRAARELRVSYRALLYKIKDYTLRPEDEESPDSAWRDA